MFQEELADIAAVQEKQATLTANVAVADGKVEVTVNAAGHVVKTVIDESYLDDYEFEKLADHLTEAAQAAAREVTGRVAEMMAPINERRQSLPGLSEIVEGAPDLRDLTPSWLDPFAAAGPQRAPDGDGGDETIFPTVRR